MSLVVRQVRLRGLAGRSGSAAGEPKLRAPKSRHEPGLAPLPISSRRTTHWVRFVATSSSRRPEELQAGGRLVGMYPIGEFGWLSR